MQVEIESPILNSISFVYENKDNLFKNPVILSKISPQIKAIANFFKIEMKETKL